MKTKTLWRVLAVPFIVLVLSLAISGTALAGWCWCTDPVVDIEGHIMNIEVELSGETQAKIPDGAKIQVWVELPRGVDAKVLSESNLTLPDGRVIASKTRINNTGWLTRNGDYIPVMVSVLVPGNGFQVAVTASVDGQSVTKEGSAGKKITLGLRIDDSDSDCSSSSDGTSRWSR